MVAIVSISISRDNLSKNLSWKIRQIKTVYAVNVLATLFSRENYKKLHWRHLLAFNGWPMRDFSFKSGFRIGKLQWFKITSKMYHLNYHVWNLRNKKRMLVVWLWFQIHNIIECICLCIWFDGLSIYSWLTV